MNPISRARTLSTLSTTGLAKKLGVSRQYISRLEQGLYERPNKEVLKWAVDILNKSLDTTINEEQFLGAYKHWQWNKRRETVQRLALRPVAVTDYDRVRQPEVIYYHKIFRQWRNDYWKSSHNFCVDMCLHPSPVADYEDGIMHTMPSQLKKVMFKLGLIGEGFKTDES